MIGSEALEAQLMALSWEGAPSMVTEVPGPKVVALMEESAKYESFTRGGGGFPVILEQGKGVPSRTPTATCTSTWPPAWP